MPIFIFKKPFLHRQSNKYFSIITADKKQFNGNLANLVTQIHIDKLSPYDDNTDRCHYTFRIPNELKKRHNEIDYFLEEDLHTFIDYAVENGYTIDYQMAKLLRKNDLILVINPPN